MTRRPLIMIADRDEKVRQMLRHALGGNGWDVVEAAGGSDALRRLDETMPDLVVLDEDEMSVEQILLRDPTMPVIATGPHGSVPRVVEAMKKGACDFVEKPFDLQRLHRAVASALEGRAFRREVIRLRSEQRRKFGDIGTEFICASRKMIEIFRIIKCVSESPATTVLIQGESGTGKELIAKAIHRLSPRRDARFMDINCAALTETLLEAELFGYEKGAFTGAAGTGKPGLLEVANGGTVFLDEIGEMPPALQAKLLRVLQEKRFKRVGGVDDIEVDVRIIASTNRDLESLVEDGRFRLDLYYRLRVIPIHVPPLRERKEDIYPIALHYLDLFSRAMGRKIDGMTPEARAALEAHDWPGNVRELRNVIERAVVLCTRKKIGPESLLFGDNPARKRSGLELDPENLSLAEMEKRLIRKVLERTSWHRTRAAKILGINRTTLYNKMREYAIAPEVG